VSSADTRRNPAFVWLGLVLLIGGFFAHYFSARAIGGSYIAYRDHIFGFFLIAIVTGAIIALLGRWLWKRRLDITVLAIGAVQAILGYVVYLNRFNVH
jgi:Fe2+ transport system protein B